MSPPELIEDILYNFMEISWLGHACFQLRGKNVTLVTDPFPPQHGETSRLSKLNASIVTISHNHPGHSYVEGIRGSGSSGGPRIVRGPGEYEISDILITGVASYHDNKHGQERGRNTIYVIHMDDLVICHLGDLGHTLQDEQLEEVADADVLLLPIGGQHSLNTTQAVEVIGQVEPRVVIPMHYSPATQDTSSEALDKFCKEMGVESKQFQPKFTVTRNTLPMEMQIVLLSLR